MIQEYKFGSITIDGKTYTHDVEVRWTGEVLEWQQLESHLIDIDDVKRAVEQNPEVIVIGTGESGGAEVTKEAQDFVQSQGIKLIIDFTESAAKTFNIRKDDSEEEEGVPEIIIGLFHLTC